MICRVQNKQQKSLHIMQFREILNYCNTTLMYGIYAISDFRIIKDRVNAITILILRSSSAFVELMTIANATVKFSKN